MVSKYFYMFINTKKIFVIFFTVKLSTSQSQINKESACVNKILRRETLLKLHLERDSSCPLLLTVTYKISQLKVPKYS